MSQNSQETWIPFDILELLEKKYWPRVVRKQFFEIKQTGEIRCLNNITRNYHEIEHVIINGEAYFITVIGSSHGTIVTVRFRVKDLVKRYFNI